MDWQLFIATLKKFEKSSKTSHPDGHFRISNPREPDPFFRFGFIK